MVYFFKYKMPLDFLGANTPIGALGLATIYGAITYGPQFIGMLFADKLKKIFKGYVNALIFMQALNIITRVIAFFIGYEGFGIWAGMILMGIGCIPVGAASIAQTSIFCDSIDYLEWKTGKRMEGVAFSMQTFFTKVSSGITMALTTGSLALLGYKAVDDSA
jgi:Na+/melibiose symporter-like transporter